MKMVNPTIKYWLSDVYTYTAFRTERDSNNKQENPFRYCGEYYDFETSSIYLRARYYVPGIGRFTQADTHWNPSNMQFGDNPAELASSGYAPSASAIMQSNNLYAYCMNSPLMYRDSSGEIAFLLVTALIGLAVGAAVGAIKSYAENDGNIQWQDVAVGAAVGAVAGLGVGAISGVLLAGSVTASTLAVTTGFNSLCVTVGTGGLYAGGQYIAQNLRNTFSNVTVLGSYPGYVNMAEQLRARVFSVPTEVWNRLSGAQQWTLNQEFLQNAVARGNQIFLSTNAYSARAGTYFYSEIQYLLNNGYRIFNEGWGLTK